MSKITVPAPLHETKRLSMANGSSGLIAWDGDMAIPLTSFGQAGREFQDKVDRSPLAPDISKVFDLPALSPQAPAPPSDLAADFTPSKKASKTATKSKSPLGTTVPQAPALCYEFERSLLSVV